MEQQLPWLRKQFSCETLCHSNSKQHMKRQLRKWLSEAFHISDCHTLHPDLNQMMFPAYLALALALFGAEGLLLGGGRDALRRNQSTSDPTLRASALVAETWPWPTSPDVAPLPPAPSPTKVIAASTFWVKDMTCVLTKFSSPTKATRHTQPVQGCDYVWAPLWDCHRQLFDLM